MEKNPATLTLERFIENWNGEFQACQLTVLDLKKPHAVMNAMLMAFDRLDIDRDIIMMPPPEELQNQHLIYYWDLLPVINVTRIINHLFSFVKQTMTISITSFLQPMPNTSHSMLLILFNLIIFNEERLRDIEPYEQVLFSKIDQVKSLEDKKNKLLTMLNELAEEKGKRAERLPMLDNEIKQSEEELRVEKEALDEEQQEFEAFLKETKQLDIARDLKKGQRDALLAELEKKKALRVYDADDIKVQAEQAAQNVQDMEEKLKSLKETLMHKENSSKNLQAIKPALDNVNNVLHDIMKCSESLRQFESGDLESDSAEGELDVLATELSELSAQRVELSVARADVTARAAAARDTRHQRRVLLDSNLREAEERDKKCKERCKKVTQRVVDIKELTAQYEQEKSNALDELAKIQNEFNMELKSMEQTLLKKAVEAKKKIEDKLRNISL